MLQARLGRTIDHVPSPPEPRHDIPLAVITFAIVFVIANVVLSCLQPKTITPTRAPVVLGVSADPPDAYVRPFSVCDSAARVNCVVDGDTFWLDGTKIRIADIDTPEIHPARCEQEERLGQASKQRLLALLNAGAFVLQTGSRDADRYGRKLRIVARDGISLGDVLVREGLAHAWDGHRHPWCN